MTTDESITLSFTVYQAALKAGSTAPLILHTHGFGLSRMKRPYLSLYGSSKPQVTATISGRIELPALLP